MGDGHTPSGKGWSLKTSHLTGKPFIWFALNNCIVANWDNKIKNCNCQFCEGAYIWQYWEIQTLPHPRCQISEARPSFNLRRNGCISPPIKLLVWHAFILSCISKRTTKLNISAKTQIIITLDKATNPFWFMAFVTMQKDSSKRQELRRPAALASPLQAPYNSTFPPRVFWGHLSCQQKNSGVTFGVPPDLFSLFFTSATRIPDRGISLDIGGVVGDALGNAKVNHLDKTSRRNPW